MAAVDAIRFALEYSDLEQIQLQLTYEIDEIIDRIVAPFDPSQSAGAAATAAGPARRPERLGFDAAVRQLRDVRNDGGDSEAVRQAWRACEQALDDMIAPLYGDRGRAGDPLEHSLQAVLAQGARLLISNYLVTTERLYGSVRRYGVLRAEEIPALEIQRLLAPLETITRCFQQMAKRN